MTLYREKLSHRKALAQSSSSTQQFSHTHTNAFTETFLD
jgi:hypothetical protein